MSDKPACPKCGKSEFVLWDTKDLKWFCWRNIDKQKFGCGWHWKPGHEQDDPTPGVTRSVAPAPTIPPVPVGSKVFCSGGREIPLLAGWTYEIDSLRCLHLKDSKGKEVYVISDGIWLLVQV